MDFNKVNRSDVLIVIISLILIAVVYFGFGNTIWSAVKKIEFKLPDTPPTTTPAPLPTSTPLPTNTPVPFTPTPTPPPVSALLTGNHLLTYWNEFDSTDPLRGDWVFFTNVAVKDSMMQIEHSDKWDGVYGNQHLLNGQTILMKFRFETWSDLHLAVESGEFGTDSYRSWGIGSEGGIFSPNYSEGIQEYTSSFGPEDIELIPDKWYVLMLHIGNEESFITKIWEFDNIKKSYEVQLQLDETWRNRKWLSFFLVGPTGRLEIDRYEEIDGLN